MNHEIELKLALKPAALGALRKHPLIRAAERAAPSATLVNTYFDTPSQDLAAARIALRTRKQGRRWVQTVKAAAESVGGLSSRPEWEQPYLGAFDFTAITDEQVRSTLECHADALVPLFTTDFRRETLRHAPREDLAVLVMIDRGTISAGERSAPICELELELERGQPADLFELALALSESVALCPANDSKAARGLRLLRGEALEPRKASPSRLRPDNSPLQAFTGIAHECLAQWQANAAGAACDPRPEFVHQMRVALRRLRSALKLFEPALPQEWARRWSEELSIEADEVGEARDIDVLHEELLAPVLAAPDCPANVRSLANKVIAARDAARGHVAAHVCGRVQGRRMLGFTAELGQLEGSALDAVADLAAYAALRLEALGRRCRKRWRAARAGDIHALHALRISLKKLRYAVEFFTPLFPRKRVRQLVQALSAAQEHLGYLNDIEVGNARLAQWAGNDAELRCAAAYVAGWHASRAVSVRAQALDDVGHLLKGQARWH